MRVIENQTSPVEVTIVQVEESQAEVKTDESTVVSPKGGIKVMVTRLDTPLDSNAVRVGEIEEEVFNNLKPLK